MTLPSRRSAPAPTQSLPAEARVALAAVMADMRDVPRAIIGDPAEVVHFLGRQARRLAGIRDMRVPMALPPAPKPPSAVLMAPAGVAAARAEAESTFKPLEASNLPAKVIEQSPTSRLVLSRRGRAVPVVLRRARIAGQLDLPL